MRARRKMPPEAASTNAYIGALVVLRVHFMCARRCAVHERMKSASLQFPLVRRSEDRPLGAWLLLVDLHRRRRVVPMAASVIVLVAMRLLLFVPRLPLQIFDQRIERKRAVCNRNQREGKEIDKGQQRRARERGEKKLHFGTRTMPFSKFRVGCLPACLSV